ncbi:hypothetical protein PENSPDRAFT_746751 [Peniophora sp. CONT]|nr:hypothetical protein PENSPDRAFT_746751 [Peniophora sp. CONT]
MIFDPSTEDHLRPWLTRTLEPICDADPEALSNYILALLKHESPEADLRRDLSQQLEEFLEKETAGFVNTLFTALRTKSYLPYTTSSTPPPVATGSNDQGIPIPLDALLAPAAGPQGRKRAGDYDEAADGRPAKGPRLSHDDQFAGRGNGHGMGNGMMGMNGMQGMNGMGMQGMPNQRIYQPPGGGRGICRDYHIKGYCSRGAMCKFSHGDDAFVPPMMGMGPMMPGGGGMGFPPGASGPRPGADTGYDPNNARLELNALGRPPKAPLMRRENAAFHAHKHGELPVIQDLTPRVPREEGSAPPPPDTSLPSNPMMGPSSSVPGGMLDQAAQMDVDFNGMGAVNPRGPARGAFGGGRPARGRGNGTFGADVQRFRPERRNDKTLVVEKIPREKLSLDAVNGWFKQFGTVTNVAVDVKTAKALVSFADHNEAHAAWKSEEAVFGNRFVKVFWHRPMEGHGTAGQRALAASANGLSARNGSEAAPTTTTAGKANGHGGSATSSALAAKQQKLETQIAEQKALMERLKTASAEEKKEVFGRLRELGKEIEATKTGSTTAAATPAPQTRKASPATDAITAEEQAKRDLLDKELELHSATVAAEGEGEDTTESLKAKLARLQAEAASLGIDPSNPEASTSAPPYAAGGYRPYRGRGRGRGRGAYGYRGGRGGPPPNMRLDNRPRRLLVKEVAPDVQQAVRDWYEATGQVESFEPTDDGDVVVAFRTRVAAEQALAKGSNIPLAGHKQVSWMAGSAPVKHAGANKDVGSEAPMEEPSYGHDEDRPMGEEEAGPSGWGEEDTML